MVPVSWGELIDKVTILEIKQARIRTQAALAHIDKELGYLLEIVARNGELSGSISNFKQQLFEVNQRLWQVEDEIRDKDAKAEFDSEFIALARKVYRLNDERAKLKKSINQALNSDLVEQKSYKEFQK